MTAAINIALRDRTIFDDPVFRDLVKIVALIPIRNS